MDTLNLLFFIAVVGYSLYSLIVYVSRRSENKGALRQLQEVGRPLRVLTAEELACLQPFLVDPLKPGKALELLGKEVYGLSGEFQRHGLRVSNGGETMHDTLGGVDVVLPYDARDFLDASNTAEVVLTPKFVIVVCLNKEFDLKGGRERAQLEQARQQQWTAGKTGELPGLAASDEIAAPALATDGTAADAEPDIGRVRILAQREETAAEAAARAHPGWGGLPTLALIPAFVLLMIAGRSNDLWLWLAPSLLFFALALWLIWRPRKPAGRRKVNRVEGTLAVVTLQNPSNSTIVRSQLFLGDKFPIVMPDHWKDQATVPPDSQVTLEMRVEDYSVVRFGKKLSIDAEEQRFPSVYWGRHLSLTLVGIAMLVAAWIFSDRIRGDLAHVQAGLLTGEMRTLEQSGAVLAQPPAAGSMVRVRARVRCQIDAIAGDTPPAIDCGQVRWGGQDIRVEAVEPDADLLTLYSGALLRARKNPMLDVMVQMRMAQQETDPYSRFLAPRPSVLMVGDLTNLIQTIDQECKREGIDNRSACARLQQTAGTKLFMNGSEANPGWETLLKQARDGSLKEQDDMALAAQASVESMRKELRDVAAARMRKTYENALQAAIDSQRGGILLPLPPEVGQTLKRQAASAEGDAGHASAPVPSAGASADWQTQWAAYQALARPESLKSIEIAGLVVGYRMNLQGDPILEIDPQRTQANYLPALLRLLGLIVGAIFLVVHGSLWVVNLRRSGRRSRAIQDYYAGKYG